MRDEPLGTSQAAHGPAALPSIRINQVGYLPGRTKRAIIVNTATSPLPWELRDSAGNVVAAGVTTVFGNDTASGDHVHTANFSSFTTPGTGYVLRVGQHVSHPFSIRADLFRQLKYDALHYFYHNRSGIPIEAEYVGEAHARPAGHLGVEPNKGDTSVPCAPGTGCNYSLDVSGGWYDAGDHGKYVVNGGISVWTLMNQYERAHYLGGSTAALADGTLPIPENRNGRPDILDEARWEMDFLLKMQVPDGQPLAGMVHHKVHDESWTGLPIRPDQDPKQRQLRPPSTAATLNLAATAAQSARIWKELDHEFAAACLRAAERAWQTALAHPAVYAPAADSTGGGPYSDDNVSDEFYWAAAELYVTTGEVEYRDFILRSPHYGMVPTAFGAGSAPAMTWNTTQALGTITLAMVPNELSQEDIAAARRSIVAAADDFVGILNRQGYRVPFAPGADGKYPWGSNSFVLNNMIIMALAYDFTEDAAYLDGVVEGMDYLLGRNAMDQSYISGYGTRPLQHPHHRFWAQQLDPQYPQVPSGALSGGPNSSLQDPYTQSAGLAGCAPQKCFVDHIESWSTNEITINWNAPLAWIAGFLDERAE